MKLFATLMTTAAIAGVAADQTQDENAQGYCERFYNSYKNNNNSINGMIEANYLTKGAEAALYKCSVNDPNQFDSAPSPTSNTDSLALSVKILIKF